METNITDKHTVYISIFIYLEVSIIKEIHTYTYIYNDEIDVRIVNNYMLASSSSTSYATSLRGSPDVVLASMNYVLKDAEQEISSTEKDLQEKKDTFKGRVIDEKKVAEKAKKVVQIAEECIKDATVSNE